MATALTTVTKVQLQLGISTDDDAIQDVVDGVNAGIENLIGVIFAQTTNTDEEYDMNRDFRVLVLKSRPVISFTRLQSKDSIDDFDSTDFTDIDTSDYVVDFTEGLITRTSNFFKGKRRYRVTYDSGYETVPADIEFAATKLASSLYDNRKTGNIETETLGQYSRTFAGEPGNWKNLGIDWVLDTYLARNVSWFGDAFRPGEAIDDTGFNSR
ncbi:hypothetical protein LCGC14_0418070 [marine sediment metagenome]|uniref:Uncharacterized protein n=1 Tax=marine sediment metagenome TaxID=412755 RepID=A0A0F9VDT6_9ZZZZ